MVEAVGGIAGVIVLFWFISPGFWQWLPIILVVAAIFSAVLMVIWQMHVTARPITQSSTFKTIDPQRPPGGSQLIYDRPWQVPGLMKAATSPVLDISAHGNQPTIFLPVAAGAYVVQMTTNLVARQWVTVPGVAISGIFVIDALGTAFFRRQ